MAFQFSDRAYTLRQVYTYTYESFRNRFTYMERDVLKSIKVQEIKDYADIRDGSPTIKYRILTSSYPQYAPYFTKSKKKPKKANSQRKVKHQYDLTLVLESLDLNARFTFREGSQRKWPKDSKIPYKKIKQLHSTIRARLKKKYTTKEKYNKMVERHKMSASFVSKGDYISKEYGINGDFYYKVMPSAFKSGNLFGLFWRLDKEAKTKIKKKKTKIAKMPFFGKHSLRMIIYLLKKGIIKR